MTKNVMRAIIAPLCLALLAPSLQAASNKPVLTCDGKIAKLHVNLKVCK